MKRVARVLGVGALLVGGLVTCSIDLAGTAKEVEPPKCPDGFSDCDGDPKTGVAGCETNLAVSLKHCGACGHACPSGGSTVVECKAGTCSATCTAGALDCNKDLADGCEVNPLGDSHNCGECGHDCLGGACSGGKCQPLALASSQAFAYSIALDDTHVYWTNFDDRTVRRVPKAGGGAEVVASSGGSPLNLALDSTHAYWTARSPDDIERATKAPSGDAGADAAGPPSQQVNFGFGSYPRGLGLTTDQAFFTVYNAGVVAWTSKTNSGSYGFVAQVSGEGPNLLVVDGTDVYWTANQIGRVYRAAQDGGARLTIDNGASLASGLAVDADYVYWAQISAGPDGGGASSSIWKWKKDGSAAKALLAVADGASYRLALDAKYVYFTNWDAGADGGAPPSGRVIRVGKDNDTTHAGFDVIASEQGAPYDVAVDDKAVYWTNNGQLGVAGSGSVMRLAK